MPGLIDSDTGLAFGEGLQFQTQIGTASLIIGPEGTTQLELVWGGFNDFLMWGLYELVWGEGRTGYILMENSGYILMEDGTSFILLQ